MMGMLWRQLKVKRRAAAWSRPNRNVPPAREALRKLRALVSFLHRAWGFNRHWLRACWLALAYAAQSGRTDLLLYGEGDAARILCRLSRHLPVTIRGICPFRPESPKRLWGRKTLSPQDLARSDATCILAAFVNTPTHLAQLARWGIGRDRLITLQ